MWKVFIDYLFFTLLKLNLNNFWITILHFIFYDFFKIIFLIFLVMMVVSYIRSFISDEKLKNILNKKSFGLNYLMASLFGAITPFCSCSSIPFFIGFIKSGVKLSVALTFLITSPLINEVLLVLMYNYYGFKITALYTITGMMLGISAGFVISLLKMEKYIIKEFTENSGEPNTVRCNCDIVPKTIKQRFHYAWRETKAILKIMYKYIFLGVALGALIHNLVPKETITLITGGKNLWAVPLAILIGIPIYAGCSTIAPTIFSISSQGVPLGTALAFLMSIAGLSLPEALILKSVMKMRLLLLFFGIVGMGIIIIGYLFNYIFPIL